MAKDTIKKGAHSKKYSAKEQKPNIENKRTKKKNQIQKTKEQRIEKDTVQKRNMLCPKLYGHL